MYRSRCSVSWWTGCADRAEELNSGDSGGVVNSLDFYPASLHYKHTNVSIELDKTIIFVIKTDTALTYVSIQSCRSGLLANLGGPKYCNRPATQ